MSRILLLVLLLAVVSTSLAQAPANDECANATVITVSTNSTCNNSVLATTLDATQSLAPCAGATANDSASKRLTAGVNSIAVPGKINQPLFIQLVTEDNVARTFKVF